MKKPELQKKMILKKMSRKSMRTIRSPIADGQHIVQIQNFVGSSTLSISLNTQKKTVIDKSENRSVSSGTSIRKQLLEMK